MASLLLPLAVAELRRPVSPVVYCSDATPTTGAYVSAAVDPSLALALFKGTGILGDRTVLPVSGLPAPPSPGIVPPDPLAEIVVSMIPWRVGRSVSYPSTVHVNIREVLERYAMC